MLRVSRHTHAEESDARWGAHRQERASSGWGRQSTSIEKQELLSGTQNQWYQTGDGLRLISNFLGRVVTRRESDSRSLGSDEPEADERLFWRTRT